MQKGVARGIFSNEAGLGSAPIAAAAAKTKTTVRQGLISMTGTFIDTIVICTMTGTTLIMTGAMDQGLEGAECTAYAFGQESKHGRFRSDALSGILRLYYDSRLGLLFRKMPGISGRKEKECAYDL